MGYRSNVVIELQGTKDDVTLVLKTYAMSEDKEEVLGANHILFGLYESPIYSPRFLQTEWVVNGNVSYVALCWEFEHVKWYEESHNAFCRLRDTIENLGDAVHVGLFFRRVGENLTDVENEDYNDMGSFNPFSNVISRIEIIEQCKNPMVVTDYKTWHEHGEVMQAGEAKVFVNQDNGTDMEDVPLFEEKANV